MAVGTHELQEKFWVWKYSPCRYLAQTSVFPPLAILAAPKGELEMDDQQLKKYFNFDEADLNANRNGTFTQKQNQRLAQDRKSGAIFMRIVGLGLLFIAALPIVILWLVGAFAVMGWLSLLWGIWPLIWGFLAFKAFRSSLSTPTSTLATATGPVNIVKDERYNASTKRYTEEHELHVGGVEFDVEAELADMMMQGDVYAVYYIKETRDILSLELLSRAK
jgi:hypothetical protein